MEAVVNSQNQAAVVVALNELRDAIARGLARKDDDGVDKAVDEAGERMDGGGVPA